MHDAVFDRASQAGRFASVRDAEDRRRRAWIQVRSSDRAFLARCGPYLAALGYGVSFARAADPVGAVDLVIVGVDAFGDGLDSLRALRDATEAAVVAVCVGGDATDGMACLEIGADDAVDSGIDAQELAARIGGILERRGIGVRDLVRFEAAAADLAACRLLRPGRPPEALGSGEVALLRAFSRNPRRALSRDDLLGAVAGLDANDRAIDSRVSRLRRKLGTRAIVTVPGHGYMFVPPFDARPDDPAIEGRRPAPGRESD